MTLKCLDLAFGDSSAAKPGQHRVSEAQGVAPLQGFGGKTHGDGFEFVPGANYPRGSRRLCGIGTMRVRCGARTSRWVSAGRRHQQPRPALSRHLRGGGRIDPPRRSSGWQVRHPPDQQPAREQAVIVTEHFGEGDDAPGQRDGVKAGRQPSPDRLQPEVRDIAPGSWLSGCATTRKRLGREVIFSAPASTGPHRPIRSATRLVLWKEPETGRAMRSKPLAGA